MNDQQLAPVPAKRGPGAMLHIYNFLSTRPGHSASVLAMFQYAKRQKLNLTKRQIEKAVYNGIFRGFFAQDKIVLTGGKSRQLYRLATLEEYEAAKKNRDIQDREVAKRGKESRKRHAKMTATKLAPRPQKVSYTAYMWDILDANHNQPMTLREIWRMMPAAMEGSKRNRPDIKRLRKIITQSVYQGYLAREGKTWQIATYEEFKIKNKRLVEKNKRQRQRKSADRAAAAQVKEAVEDFVTETPPVVGTARLIEERDELRDRLKKALVKKDHGGRAIINREDISWFVYYGLASAVIGGVVGGLTLGFVLSLS